jgi:hypothetical protein
MTRTIGSLKGGVRKDLGLATRRRVLDALPLDGSRIRSQDLFAEFSKRGIPKMTALPALKWAVQEGAVLVSTDLVKGRPGVFYRLAVEWLFPVSRENLATLMGHEGQWPQLFHEGAKGFRSRANLERFLNDHLNLLLQTLAFGILNARAAPSQEEAKHRTELLMDYAIRRWASEIAEVMWVTRERSNEPFLKALRRVRLILPRTETLRIGESTRDETVSLGAQSAQGKRPGKSARAAHRGLEAAHRS